MSNGLVRANLLSARVEYNGDRNDHELRRELDKLDKEATEQKMKVEDLKKRIANGEQNLKGSLTKTENKLAETLGEKKKKQPDKDNAIIATFAYPRSGSSSVLASRPLDLPAGKEVKWDPNADFLDAGLFKEIVHGETVLEIHITDRDKKNPFWVFIRKVLGAIFSTVTSSRLGDVTDVVVGGTASTIAGGLQTALVGTDKDRVETVAKSEKVKIRLAGNEIKVLNAGKNIRFSNGVLEVDLKTTSEIKTGQEYKLVNGEVKTVPKVIKKGTDNGMLRLRLSVESMP